MIRNLLALVVESIPDTIYQVFDKDLKIIGAFGEAKLEEIGLSASKMKGKPLSQAHSKELASLLVPLSLQLFSMQRSNQVFYQENGRTWEHLFLPVEDETGTVVAGMIMSKDITEIENSKKKLKEVHGKLYEIGWIASHKVRGPVARLDALLNLVANHEIDSEISKMIETMRVPVSELYEIVKRIDEKSEIGTDERNISLFL